MKKHLNKMRLLFLAVFIASTAMVSARDITIFDQNISGSGWYAGATDLQTHAVPIGYDGAFGADPDAASRQRAVREDNETEPPNSVQHQRWDLEAITLTGTTLAIVGGYRWDVGTKANNTWTSGVNLANDSSAFYPGDIFISVDGAVNPVAAGLNFVSIPNPGFEYVIAFDGYERGAGAANAQGVAVGSGGTGTFKIYSLSATDRVVAVNNFAAANAFRWLPGYGTEIPIPAAFKTATQSGAMTDAAATSLVNIGTPLAGQRSLIGDSTPNVLGASHYALSLDITFLLDEFVAGNTFGAHFTMGCGNDEIVGWLPPSSLSVPDGGTTLTLLGLGMMGLHMARRKNS